MKKHNKWLEQQLNETNEAYNERIGDFEAKEREKQAIKIAELELIEQWLTGERKRHKEECKEPSDFDKGVSVALAYVDKYIECIKSARECILHNPLEYELQLQPDGDYKLGKR